jgi:hypothetical protein
MATAARQRIGPANGLGMAALPAGRLHASAGIKVFLALENPGSPACSRNIRTLKLRAYIAALRSIIWR